VSPQFGEQKTPVFLLRIGIDRMRRKEPLPRHLKDVLAAGAKEVRGGLWSTKGSTPSRGSTYVEGLSIIFINLLDSQSVFVKATSETHGFSWFPDCSYEEVFLSCPDLGSGGRWSDRN
jgi:hypothetical protein